MTGAGCGSVENAHPPGRVAAAVNLGTESASSEDDPTAVGLDELTAAAGYTVRTGHDDRPEPVARNGRPAATARWQMCPGEGSSLAAGLGLLAPGPKL
jgi:hypothetical protein